MSGPTKAELLEQLDRARADADAATDAALNAERERDEARVNHTMLAINLAGIESRGASLERERDRAVHDLTRAVGERDLAQIQLQATMQSEQELRAALRGSDDISAGLRKQLDEARATKDLHKKRCDDAELAEHQASARAAAVTQQLKAEREARSRVEGELRQQIREAETRLAATAADWAVENHDHFTQVCDLQANLARTVQTSHDREAALHDALIAVTRSKP